MSEQPKRVVSKGQYLKSLLMKGGLYATAIPVGFFGVGILIAAACFMVEGGLSSRGDIGMIVFLIVNGIIMSAIGLAGIWYFRIALKAARKMEAVTPITLHNTGHLPMAETLVRGSDRPSTDPQVELLRAAGVGSPTPADELLRSLTTPPKEKE